MPYPRKLLVVEDEQDIREALCAVLAEEGYRVVSAREGAEALALLRQGRPPAAILLDLSMPVMDGLEFLESRRAVPRLAPVPVIVLTAGGDGGRALSAGATALLAKPFDLAALLSLVRRVTAPARARRPRAATG